MVDATGVAVKPAVAQAAPSDPSKTSGAMKVTAPFMISPMQDRDRWLKMLVYAKHGVGKTELMGSAVDVAQMRDVIMIDAEKGDLTLMDSDRIKNPGLISHIQVDNFKQVVFIQEFLRAYCNARDKADIKKMSELYRMVSGIETDTPPQYRTVIIDTATEVEAYCQYQILKIDDTKVLKDDDGMDVAGWPEFRKNLEMVKLMIRHFRDLPMNVLVACSEGYTQDENKRYHYSPAMTGKLGSQIQGFFDIVGWITTGPAPADGGSAPRRMYVQPVGGGPRFDAKNRRSSYKEAYFENPSMEGIMRGIGLLKA